MTAILLVGFGLMVIGISAILAAIYLSWRQLALELDDVRKREIARERVNQLMTKVAPEPADEPPSTKLDELYISVTTDDLRLVQQYVLDGGDKQVSGDIVPVPSIWSRLRMQ